ncbi:MAG: PadR family transcriptional regulator [Micromonosporaceae bacterium]
MRRGDEESGRERRHGRRRVRGPGFGFGGPGFGPPFGGPGFGPGFPFGGGPRRGRGGRRNRGDVRSAVLVLLAEQPMHGYQLIGEIAERSEGMWRPSAGSVYPVLQQLEDEGLVRIERVEGRRVVHLTEAGTAYVAEHKDQLAAVFDTVTGSVDDSVMELFGLMQQAGMAATQVAHAGTPNQVARAHKVLERARQDLYKILADGDLPEDSEADTP